MQGAPAFIYLIFAISYTSSITALLALSFLTSHHWITMTKINVFSEDNCLSYVCFGLNTDHGQFYVYLPLFTKCPTFPSSFTNFSYLTALLVLMFFHVEYILFHSITSAICIIVIVTIYVPDRFLSSCVILWHFLCFFLLCIVTHNFGISFAIHFLNNVFICNSGSFCPW